MAFQSSLSNVEALAFGGMVWKGRKGAGGWIQWWGLVRFGGGKNELIILAKKVSRISSEKKSLRLNPVLFI